MAPPRKTPDISQLLMWRDLGWTHQQMVDHIFEQTGIIVARSSISAALSRAGRTTTQERYADCLPWKVRTRHLKEYPAQMLRLLGKRRHGQPISMEQERRLEVWLESLRRANAVVGYDPGNDEKGFHYVDPLPGEGSNGVPIRVREIRTRPW